MNLIAYTEAKQARERQRILPRVVCARCRQPQITCYCAKVVPFVSWPSFVILIHRDEHRRSIATGRMAHLCLSNSWLIEGTDFSKNEAVARILTNPKLYPVVLYPTPAAVNLSPLTVRERRAYFPKGRQPVFFIVDGTWGKAKKMWRLSQNIKTLPAFSITPRRPSTFRVRKQPKPHCLSTLEAIHEVIDLLAEPKEMASRPHDNLLAVFEFLVETHQACSVAIGRKLR